MLLPPPLNDVDYAYVREHDVREWWDPSIQPHAALGYQLRIRLLLEQVRSHVLKGSKILDVGCAQGTLGLLLAESGYRVTLLDIREAHVRYARDRYEHGVVDFRVGRLAEAIPALPAFDAIVCTEVLEHVRAPGILLLEIAARLLPGGLLFVTTPNAEYSASRLPSFGSASQDVIEGSEMNSCDGDAHRYLYSREELTALIRGVGLRADEVAFALPFWTQGHLKTRYAISLWYEIVQRLPSLPTPKLFTGRIARRISSCLVARARAP
jgi:2-polyprenyl-3-methyl-5-hydroxy-6-metoxy-1,4-benzoquinol methylase